MESKLARDLTRVTVRSLCDAYRIAELPVGLDYAVLKKHNQVHPPGGGKHRGASNVEYWLENMCPDGEGGLLLVHVESVKYPWEPNLQTTRFVYRLRDGEMNPVEDGLSMFQTAEANTPAELRLLCTLSAGQGGGSEVAPDIACTRLGTIMHMDTEDGDDPPPEFMLQHFDKVPLEVVPVEERQLVAETVILRFQEAFLASGGSFTAKVDIYSLVEDLLEYRQANAS